MQVTSIGDVFFQNFTVTQNPEDITWSLGPGSHRLRIGEDVKEYCQKWVAEAETIEEETRRVFPAHTVGASQEFKGGYSSFQQQRKEGGSGKNSAQSVSSPLCVP